MPGSSAVRRRHDRRETEIRRQAGHARVAGHRLFDDRDPEGDVLDLTFDSLLDDPGGLTSDLRRLRFAGPGRAVQVDVRGMLHLAVTVRVQPAGALDGEVWVRDTEGRSSLAGVCGSGWTPVRAGLTSFAVRWPGGGPAPARTAWLRL
ncbi:MAG: hypothetical protein GEV10_29070 [Streptosporangiales bacterium]|nr:hypothetical protein [Streptosporangiales bacterium]